MELTENTVYGIRDLLNPDIIRVNGVEYMVMEKQPHPKSPIVLEKKKETRAEGVELYLATKRGPEAEPGRLSPDHKLVCIDFDVDYELAETMEGIKDVRRMLTEMQSIKFDFEKKKTHIYRQEYRRKKLKDIVLKFMDMDNKEVKLKSIEIG